MKKVKVFLTALLAFTLSGCFDTCNHIDENHDCKCDECGQIFHMDENHDCVCDNCHRNLTHVDNNKDHKCDNCDKVMSTCRDYNNDHKCDVCKKVLSECEDSNSDHLCDVCGKTISEHKDNNNDHYCDVCQEMVSNHVDNNNDGYCDICSSKISERHGVVQLDLYGINDMHGAVTTEIGLINMGTYMKSKTDKPNTLFIDSGDTWQGSVESNLNKGNLITDVFSYAKLSARTIGNHDFDWGLDALKANSARSYNNYKIPTLGANIYDYDFENKTVGTTQQSEIAQEYVIYELQNGLKVGIVGVIGSDQITSISTNLCKDIIFTDHIEKIKSVSDILRTQKGCDLVIASEHDGYSYEEDALTNISRVSNKRYVDFVFNGHTHYNEQYKVDGVYFAQCGANGDAVGHATLKYNFDTGEVQTEYECFNTDEIISEVNKIGKDQTIVSIVNEYARTSDPVGSRVLTTKMSGNFVKNENLVNLMCEALYWECENENIDVDFTYSNTARDAIFSYLGKEVTYKEIFKSFPFDNVVYVLNVTGRQSMSELAYYNCVYNTGINKVYANNTYKVAVLDYLAYHTDKNRFYDYFPGSVTLDYLKKSDGSPYYYRDILADYLQDHPNKYFYADDYSQSQDRFTRPIFSY